MKNLLRNEWNIWIGQGTGKLNVPAPGLVSKSAMITPISYELISGARRISMYLEASKFNGGKPDTDLRVIPLTQYSLRAWVRTEQPRIKVLVVGWDKDGIRKNLFESTVPSTGEWQVIDALFMASTNIIYASPGWGLYGSEAEGYMLDLPLTVANPVMVQGGLENLPEFKNKPLTTAQLLIPIGVIGGILAVAIKRRK